MPTRSADTANAPAILKPFQHSFHCPNRNVQDARTFRCRDLWELRETRENTRLFIVSFIATIAAITATIAASLIYRCLPSTIDINPNRI